MFGEGQGAVVDFGTYFVVRTAGLAEIVVGFLVVLGFLVGPDCEGCYDLRGFRMSTKVKSTGACLRAARAS